MSKLTHAFEKFLIARRQFEVNCDKRSALHANKAFAEYKQLRDGELKNDCFR
jgi:hypothetical protein